ncbi:MAG: hypothetical protein N2Z21_03360 [Candidatus Sumerlaeaceae bacterium]|nr:hypothetical protein [Candidatus Sumerlaeaceae bacterium]
MEAQRQKLHPRGTLWVLLGLVASGMLAVLTVKAAEQLMPQPEPSPNGEYAANVEWESLGQVGALRMVVYAKDKRLRGTVEVPQVRPDPADLTWLNERWVMCESFLGERASGFFYVDAKELRGYLLEIFAVRSSGAWDFDVTYADRETSMSVSAISSGRSCLFPIVLGPLPETEDAYFTLEFCERFAAAVHACLDWKRKQNIESLDFIGEPALRPGIGGLSACFVGKEPAVIWFPLSSLSCTEVLNSCRIIRLDPSLRAEFSAHREQIRTVWLREEKPQSWRFAIKLASSTEGKSDKPESTLYEGVLENLKDSTAALLLGGSGPGMLGETSSSGTLKLELKKHEHKTRSVGADKKRRSSLSRRNR